MNSGKHFDIIYSIAAFEHIYDLHSCLEAAYTMLSSGGILYSYFTPIWSAPNGSHGFHPNEISSYGDHCHLKFNFNSLVSFLVDKYSYSFSQAIAAAHSLYKDSQINRYTYEEYITIFQSLPFSDLKINAFDKQLFSELYDKDTHDLIKANYPSMFSSARGFEIILTK